MRIATIWSELFPAEQARIVQLLVERVDVQADALEVRVRAEELASVVGELRETVAEISHRVREPVTRAPLPRRHRLPRSHVPRVEAYAREPADRCWNRHRDDQQALGHSKPDVPLRIYAHLFAKVDTKASEAIDAALKGLGGA